MGQTQTEPLLIDVETAAALLGVRPRLLYGLAARNAVPHVRIGRYVRFRRDSLIRWVEETETAPNGARQR